MTGTFLNTGLSPRHAQAQMADENRRWPVTLREIPREAWPKRDHSDERRIQAWRSRDFLVQAFHEGGGIIRLSINRSSIDMRTARWRDGITWDELQRLKAEAGYGDHCAVEVYPPDADVINVANVRHLWVLPDAPAFAWRAASA